MSIILDAQWCDLVRISNSDGGIPFHRVAWGWAISAMTTDVTFYVAWAKVFRVCFRRFFWMEAKERSERLSETKRMDWIVSVSRLFSVRALWEHEVSFLCHGFSSRLCGFCSRGDTMKQGKWCIWIVDWKRVLTMFLFVETNSAYLVRRTWLHHWMPVAWKYTPLSKNKSPRPFGGHSPLCLW